MSALAGFPESLRVAKDTARKTLLVRPMWQTRKTCRPAAIVCHLPGCSFYNAKIRVAAKELKLRDYKSETTLFTIHPYYGNLIYVP